MQGEIVIIESPFKGSTPAEEAENIAYAKEAMRDSLYRGEAPFASHLLYPQMLDDADERERRMGIEAVHGAAKTDGDRFAAAVGYHAGHLDGSGTGYQLDAVLVDTGTLQRQPGGES